MTNLRLATTTEPISWESAQEAFLARDLAPTTRRSYLLVLEALGAALGHVPPQSLTVEQVTSVCSEVYGQTAPTGSRICPSRVRCGLRMLTNQSSTLAGRRCRTWHGPYQAAKRLRT